MSASPLLQSIQTLPHTIALRVGVAYISPIDTNVDFIPNIRYSISVNKYFW